MTKVCNGCLLEKSAAEFSNRYVKGRRYLRSRCKTCDSLSLKEYRAANDELELRRKRRRSSIKTEHGITEEDYLALSAKQDGRCAICRITKCEITSLEPRRKRLHIDHCHATGRIRGLLCGPCNALLGLARDRPDVIRAAACYLESADTGLISVSSRGLRRRMQLAYSATFPLLESL